MAEQADSSLSVLPAGEAGIHLWFNTPLLAAGTFMEPVLKILSYIIIVKIIARV